MKTVLKYSAAASFVAAMTAASPAWSHNFLTATEAPAGYRVDVELLVTHGCKGSPVKEVRIKIPEEIESTRPHHNHDWDIETKMRKLGRTQAR